MTRALVTGATAGIGYAIALQLAREGAEVIVHGRDAERGRKTVQDIENNGGTARFIAADLTDADDVKRLAREAGDVDVLVNNAGIYTFSATAETSDADYDTQFDINLHAPFGARTRPGHGTRGLAGPTASYINGAVVPVDGGDVALSA